MAVDMFIHAVNPALDQEEPRCIFHNHLGHPLEDLEYECPLMSIRPGRCAHRQALYDSDAVEIGSKHWQHPWWTGQAPDDLLDPITAVASAFEDVDVVTPELLSKAQDAYDLPSTKMFPMEGIDQYRDRVITFLRSHIGERVFIIGW